MTLDPRSIILNLRGTRATDVEIGFLKSRLPAGLKPDWLMALLRGNALAGVNFSLTIAQGHSGDANPVGEGVSELRIHYGRGYRVYFQKRGSTVVVLPCGGDKRTHATDLRTAKRLAGEWSE